MVKNIFLLFGLIPIFTFAQTPKVSSGSIKHFQSFQSKYVTARNVDVWLPDGYTPKKKYAVLYMQDGQALFDSAVAEDKLEWGVDETFAKLINERKIKNCIVVGVWNTGKLRHSDYFPQKPFETISKPKQDSLYKIIFNGVLMMSEKVQSDNYLKFVVKELKLFIDNKFSTLKDKGNTFIAGSSMGGLISMYAVCEYPDVFGGAACLSTWWPGLLPSAKNPIPLAFNQYLQTNMPPGKSHKLYFDTGTTGFDIYIKPLQPNVDTIILNKGYSAENFLSREFKGAGHSGKFWRERLEIPIIFLLENKR